MSLIPINSSTLLLKLLNSYLTVTLITHNLVRINFYQIKLLVNHSREGFRKIKKNWNYNANKLYHFQTATTFVYSLIKGIIGKQIKHHFKSQTNKWPFFKTAFSRFIKARETQLPCASHQGRQLQQVSIQGKITALQVTGVPTGQSFVDFTHDCLKTSYLHTWQQNLKPAYRSSAAFFPWQAHEVDRSLGALSHQASLESDETQAPGAWQCYRSKKRKSLDTTLQGKILR